MSPMPARSPCGGAPPCCSGAGTRLPRYRITSFSASNSPEIAIQPVSGVLLSWSIGLTSEYSICPTLCRSAASLPHERFVDVTPMSLWRDRQLHRLVRQPPTPAEQGSFVLGSGTGLG